MIKRTHETAPLPESTHLAPSNPATAKVRTADDITRLLAERNLPSGRGGPVIWAWLLGLPLLWILLSSIWFEDDVTLFWGFVFAALTTRAISRISANAMNARAALLLPELNGEWLGPLIDALTHPAGALREIARLRLITILPTLTEYDYDTLSPARRALLFDHLAPGKAARDVDLAGAILQFGAAVGDAQAAESAQRLAGVSAYTFARVRVRTIARGLLPRLEERVVVRIQSKRSESADIPRDRAPETERQLSPEARSWLAEIEAESVRRPGMRFGFLLASWGVIVPYMLYEAVKQWQAGNPVWAAISALGAGLATQLYRFALRPQQVRLAAKLGSVDNVEAVGPLAEMVAWPDERIRSMAIAALTRLLPRMRSSDTQLLSPVQRSILYSCLTPANARRYAEFQIALLSALEQVGDTDALPFVQSLAGERPSTLRERQVVEAANACLPYLEGCAHQNRNTQILLRPISDTVLDANLLRPARTQIDINPDLLVRTAAPSEPG